jgi:hypothetical protein
MKKESLQPFSIPHPNRKLSPVTGMDRDGWLACGRHILEGAFSHVKNMEDPMFFPKMPGPGYPTDNKTASRQQRSAAIFEAVARSFNIAAPLILDNPDITIQGIRIQDYYKKHLLELITDEESDIFIGKPSDYPAHVQQTCEMGNLCLWMLIAPDAFWNVLNQKEKSALAKAIQRWAKGQTLPHNWRWFNVMMCTFLAIKGYDYDEELMLNHLDHLLLHYAGDGWYRDTSYDYYTCHVFHLYGAVWNKYYGREHAPKYAKVLDRHFEEFEHHYPQIFSRKGEVLMYGRSILYRLGASAGMAAAALRDQPNQVLTPGLSRRVASGALLQFASHPDFFYKGIPALGFYGPFQHAIQCYSCSASPFWMFMNFTCLTLPKDHPFWTQKEEMGDWGKLNDKTIYNSYWKGPGFLVTNHGKTGTAEIRPSKIHNQDPNYSRLVYNSSFPWAANETKEVVAGAISLKRGKEAFDLPRMVSSAGARDGILYRQAEFSGHLPPSIDMATLMIPGGEIRIDRVRRINPCRVIVGHFSLPHLGAEPTIARSKSDGKTSLQMAIPNRQLAMTLYSGWDRLGVKKETGLNPEAKNSSIIYAEMKDEKSLGPVRILISILLHKTDNSPWTDSELQPIASVRPLHPNLPDALAGLLIKLKDGTQHRVDFQDIDGTNSIW